MSCGVGCRHGLDPKLLWLWCRPAAIALIGPLAWESPYAAGAALEKTKKQKNKKKQKKKPKTLNSKHRSKGSKNLHVHWGWHRVAELQVILVLFPSYSSEVSSFYGGNIAHDIIHVSRVQHYVSNSIYVTANSPPKYPVSMVTVDWFPLAISLCPFSSSNPYSALCIYLFGLVWFVHLFWSVCF